MSPSPAPGWCRTRLAGFRRRPSKNGTGLPTHRRPAGVGDTADWPTTSCPWPSAPGPVEVPQVPGAHPAFDVDTLRPTSRSWPEAVNGKPLIWFDNARHRRSRNRSSTGWRTSTPTRTRTSTAPRHELAAHATDAYEEARETVRRFIGAEIRSRSSSCAATTEAINLVAAKSGVRNTSGQGDEIVISPPGAPRQHRAVAADHQQTGRGLRVIPVDDDGNLLLASSSTCSARPDQEWLRHAGFQRPGHHITAGQGRSSNSATAMRRPGADRRRAVHPAIPIDVRSARTFRVLGHKIFGPHRHRRAVRREDVPGRHAPGRLGGNMIADVT